MGRGLKNCRGEVALKNCVGNNRLLCVPENIDDTKPLPVLRRSSSETACYCCYYCCNSSWEDCWNSAFSLNTQYSARLNVKSNSCFPEKSDFSFSCCFYWRRASFFCYSSDLVLWISLSSSLLMSSIGRSGMSNRLLSINDMSSVTNERFTHSREFFCTKLRYPPPSSVKFSRPKGCWVEPVFCYCYYYFCYYNNYYSSLSLSLCCGKKNALAKHCYTNYCYCCCFCCYCCCWWDCLSSAGLTKRK